MPKNSNQEDFRKALRCMPASVSIVNASDGINKTGMTISSAVSVSFSPLSFLVCINKVSLFYDMIINQNKFCINLLKKNQIEISDKFSRPASEKNIFDNGNWLTHDGLPYIEGAQVNLFLDIRDITHFGTHGIFIGEVGHVIYEEEISPLIYLNGSYLN
jgi:flavin reductase